MFDFSNDGAEICVVGRTGFHSGIGSIGYATAELLARNFPVSFLPTEPHARESPTNRTGHPAGEGARFDDTRPVMDFETAALPYAVAIGDVVTRLADGTRYAVSDPSCDGFSRTVLALTARDGNA